MGDHMNSYERVLMAFTKQKSDHVPIYCGSVSSRIASQILGHDAYIGGSIQSYRETLALFHGEEAHKEFLERSRQDAYDWAAANELDLVRTTYWRYNYKPSKIIDEYTFRYDREDGTYWIMKFFPEPELFQCVADTAHVIDDVDMLEAEVINQEKYTERYVPSPSAHSDYIDAMKYFAYEKASYTGGIALAIPNTSAIWYECVAARPDLVDRYLEALMKRALKNIPLISAIGAKFVYGGGDCACNRGLMYSNEVFRSMVVPRFRKISDACHKYGLFHTFGSDGYFWDVADSLYIDSGIDGHYEADCTCGMDIRSVRSRYPNITVIGGIGASTLDRGSKEQVKKQVMEAVSAAKEYGGAIVGCSNLVSPSTPIGNFELMMELLHKYK
jgi:hypothetical protein